MVRHMCIHLSFCYNHNENLIRDFKLLQEPFNVSSEISGSASVYTVNFIDYNSGVSCGLTKIPAAC